MTQTMRHDTNNATNSSNNNSTSPRTSGLLKHPLSLFSSDNRHSTIDPMATAFGFVGPSVMEEKNQRQRYRLEYDQEGNLGVNGEEESDECSHERSDEDEAGESESRDAKKAFKQQEKLRLDAIADRFALEEHDLLHQVFSMMDYDGSGAVNRQEMTWALQRDEEVSAMASKSMLLRALLKEHTQLDELFSHLDGSSPPLVDTIDHNKQSGEELTWEVFIAFCEQQYVSLMVQGSLRPLVTQERAGPTFEQVKYQQQQSESQSSRAQVIENENADPNGYSEAEEEQKVRDLFAFVDCDANGVLEAEELQHALYDTSRDEISRLVRSSKALQPLLHQKMFMDAFRKFETEDPRGISQEEFVGFCLEIASIAMLNGML